jgi:hypothetical protein
LIAEAKKFASTLRVYPHLRDSDIGINTELSGHVLAMNFGSLQAPIFLPQGTYSYQLLDVHTEPSNYFVSKFFPLESNRTNILLNEIDALQSLEEDWDGEGGLPISQETLNRAKVLATKIGQAIDAHDSKIDLEAGPGPKESIDFEYNDEDYLLINIPANSEQPPTFYAKKKNGLELKGIFDPENSTLISLLLN